MSQSPSFDWGDIKSAYLNSDMLVGDICRLFGVTTSRLYRRINGENWQRRQARHNEPTHQPHVDGDKQGAKRTARLAMGTQPFARIDRADLFKRLFRVVDHQLSVLEAKLSESGDDIDLTANAAARERDARTLTSLVRLLEKINDLEPGKQQQAHDINAIDASDEGAAVHLREELAQRIHTLLQEEQD